MKKVIKGLLYNTDTASEVGAWDNGHYSNDFNFCEETLYRKKTGEYFIYGRGGAMSKYAEWHGNSGGSGEEIRPYTLQEAREWAEEHLTVEEYNVEYGEPKESEIKEEKGLLNLSVSPEIKKKLEKMRQETGKSISQIVSDLVQEI